MMRIACVLLVGLASTSLWGSQDRPRVDRERLEWFKSLSPEQKEAFRERMKRLRNLPPEERQRLLENRKRWKELSEEQRREIRERCHKLSDEQRARFTQAAQALQEALGGPAPQGFPRGLFFMWMKKEKPGEIDRILQLAPGDRLGTTQALLGEFKGFVLRRFESHVKTANCGLPEQVEILRGSDSADFWSKLQEFRAACPHKPAFRPGERTPGGRPPNK